MMIVELTEEQKREVVDAVQKVCETKVAFVEWRGVENKMVVFANERTVLAEIIGNKFSLSGECNFRIMLENKRMMNQREVMELVECGAWFGRKNEVSGESGMAHKCGAVCSESLRLLGESHTVHFKNLNYSLDVGKTWLPLEVEE